MPESPAPTPPPPPPPTPTTVPERSPTPVAPKAQHPEAESFAKDIARLLHDDKCTEVVVLDVRGLSQVTDYIVIGTGSSDRQMRSVLQHVEDLGPERGMSAFRSHSDDNASWLLADFVHVVVHLFEPNARAHYDLEMLWGDAPRLPWERPDQQRRDMAGLTPERR